MKIYRVLFFENGKSKPILARSGIFGKAVWHSDSPHRCCTLEHLRQTPRRRPRGHLGELGIMVCAIPHAFFLSFCGVRSFVFNISLHSNDDLRNYVSRPQPNFLFTSGGSDLGVDAHFYLLTALQNISELSKTLDDCPRYGLHSQRFTGCFPL